MTVKGVGEGRMAGEGRRKKGGWSEEREVSARREERG